MVVLQQLSRNILLWAAAYDTVQKQTVLTLQSMKRGFIMILNQKKVKLANQDTTTKRKSDSNLGIYLTTAKVFQCIQVAENRREKEEAKKVT